MDPAKNPPGFIIRSLQTAAGQKLFQEGADPAQPGVAPGGLDGELEGVSQQALGLLLGKAAASVKSLEIRPGAIFLRGGP